MNGPAAILIRPLCHRATVGIASALVILVYWIYFGSSVGGDAIRYLGRGEKMLVVLSGEMSMKQAKWDVFDVLFLVPNLFIGAGGAVFGPSFGIISILINIGLFLLAVSWVTRFSHTAAGQTERISVVGLVLLLILFLGLPGEVVKYVYNFYSSDTIFLFVSTVCLVTTLKALLTDEPRMWVLSLCMAVLTMLTRPPGLVLVAIWTMGFLAMHLPWRKKGLLVAGMGSVLAITAFTLWPWVVWRLAESESYPSYSVALLLDQFKDGVVVTGRESLRLDGMNGYADYAQLMLYRFFYYLVPFREGYSTPHVLVNVLTTGVVAVGAAAGLGVLRRRGSRHRLAASIMVLCVVFYGVFHAATQVEDWRYYMATWPPIWILGCIGILGLDRKLRSLSNQATG